MMQQWTLSQELSRFPSARSIAIIGNSPRLGEQEYGSEIDGHDVVIRVNDGRTIGFERHAGARTDIRFVGIPLKARHLAFFRVLREDSLLVTRAQNKEIVAELALPNPVVWMDSYARYARTAFSRLKRLIELKDLPDKNPRSGIVIISLLTQAIQGGATVTLYGFETESRVAGAEHYYNDNRSFAANLRTWDQFHCPIEYEFSLLKRMKEQNIIRVA